MTIAPNGVAIADYDPTGVGAIVFASIQRANLQANVALGDVIDSSVVAMYAAGVSDHSSNPTNQISGGVQLTGSWQCLGSLYLNDANCIEAAAPFMRVA